MAKEYKLTLERLKELQDELTYLKTVREKEVAELIKEARSFGDLSENSEYDEAKTEQGKLYSRIAEVEEILGNCVVIEDSDDVIAVLDDHTVAQNLLHLGNTGVELALFRLGLVILAVLAQIAEGTGLLDQLGDLLLPDCLEVGQFILKLLQPLQGQFIFFRHKALHTFPKGGREPAPPVPNDIPYNIKMGAITQYVLL